MAGTIAHSRQAGEAVLAAAAALVETAAAVAAAGRAARRRSRAASTGRSRCASCIGWHRSRTSAFAHSAARARRTNLRTRRVHCNLTAVTFPSVPFSVRSYLGVRFLYGRKAAHAARAAHAAHLSQSPATSEQGNTERAAHAHT